MCECVIIRVQVTLSLHELMMTWLQGFQGQYGRR